MFHFHKCSPSLYRESLATIPILQRKKWRFRLNSWWRWRGWRVAKLVSKQKAWVPKAFQLVFLPRCGTCSHQMFVESLLWLGAVFGAKNKVNRDIAKGSLKCNVWNIIMRSYKKFHGIPEEWQNIAGSFCIFKLMVTYRMVTYDF